MSVGERIGADPACRRVLDQLVALVRVWTPAEGVVYVNRAWRDLTGTTLEDNLGEGWLRAVHAEDRAAVLVAFGASPAPRSADYRLTTHDGQTVAGAGHAVALDRRTRRRHRRGRPHNHVRRDDRRWQRADDVQVGARVARPTERDSRLVRSARQRRERCRGHAAGPEGDRQQRASAGADHQAHGRLIRRTRVQRAARASPTCRAAPCAEVRGTGPIPDSRAGRVPPQSRVGTLAPGRSRRVDAPRPVATSRTAPGCVRRTGHADRRTDRDRRRSGRPTSP